MINYRLLSVSAVALALAGMSGEAALAQVQSAPTRGTVKVRSRVFNPFDVGPSRLTLNPLGVFSVNEVNPFAVSNPGSVVPSAASATGGSATGSTTTAGNIATASAPAAATAEASATGSGTALVGPAVTTANNSDELTIEPSVIVPYAVRPPFRPPVRSPWRPPPRPPFIPP
jgi:hypothetical protein